MKPILLVATSNPEKSRQFYQEVLNLEFIAEQPHALVFNSAGNQLRVQIVDKVIVQPYTAAGWEVEQIEPLVQSLVAKGVSMERYPFLEQDDLGIWTTPDGARIAWFCDPDQNLLSLTQFPAS